MTTLTSVRLPDDLNQKLSSLAERTGRNKSYYIREILEENLDSTIAKYDLIERAALLRAGKIKGLTAEELEALITDA